MAEPYIPFYPADYLADTMHLSLEEHGAYLKLLMVLWRAGGYLADDDKKLCMVLGVNSKKWLTIKASISPFFNYCDGQFYQKRLLAERKKAEAKSKTRSDVGSMGGLAKSQKNNDSTLAIATVLPEFCHDTRARASDQVRLGSKEVRDVSNETSPPPPKTNLKKKIVIPDWVNLDAWNAYVEMRRKIPHSAFTDHAQVLALRDLDALRAKGHDPTAVMEQSIQRGWKGFFTLKHDEQGAANAGSAKTRPTATHARFEQQDYRAGTEGFEVT